MIPSFPKVLRLGDRNILDILKNGYVEITEKVDGSSFAFGIDESGELLMRSRGQVISVEEPPQKLFLPVFNYVLENWRRWVSLGYLAPGDYAYGETLARPRHNTLVYDRVPLNNLAIFGAYSFGAGLAAYHSTLVNLASLLEFDVVPLLWSGDVTQHDSNFSASSSFFADLLTTDSFLGKEKIEGFVVRNLSQRMTYFGTQEPYPPLGKYVRPDFKEMNDKSQREGEYGRAHSKIEGYLENYHSEARWMKAVQRLIETDVIEGRMQDMPKILDEIKRDLFEEETENIKDDLFRLVKSNLEKVATRGLGSWYAEHLATRALN